MNSDKSLKSILNKLVDDTNHGTGQYQHSNEVARIGIGEKINRVSSANRPEFVAGQRVLEY